MLRQPIAATARDINGDDRRRTQHQQRPLQRAHVPVPDRGSSACVVNSTACSMSTLTRRDTPGSCMVTPCSCCASSIVILLFVMIMNCTFCAIYDRKGVL